MERLAEGRFYAAAPATAARPAADLKTLGETGRTRVPETSSITLEWKFYRPDARHEIRPQSHKPVLLYQIRIIQKMFHVKHFCPVAIQNLTRQKTAILLAKVQSAGFLVQLESGGELGFFGMIRCPTASHCKIGWNPVFK